MTSSLEPKFNKQLFENSPLRGLFEDDELSETEVRPFFNGKNPNLAILHEKPEHRVLLMLKAQGMSNREIAKRSGYTEAWMSQLFRQPWATALLSEFITDAGLDVLDTMIKAEAVPSLLRLVEVRDMELNPKTASVIASSCVSLLERHLGKPVQQVKVDQTTRTAASTVAEVDQKIKDLETETNRLLGVKPTTGA